MEYKNPQSEKLLFRAIFFFQLLFSHFLSGYDFVKVEEVLLFWSRRKLTTAGDNCNHRPSLKARRRRRGRRRGRSSMRIKVEIGWLSQRKFPQIILSLTLWNLTFGKDLTQVDFVALQNLKDTFFASWASCFYPNDACNLGQVHHTRVHFFGQGEAEEKEPN